MQQAKEYDYVIIGSGFGGSVSALRLAEKGYKVLVIEKGKWFKAKDFPKTNWNLPKWLWMPALRWFGIMKISFFRHITILSGSGVGGGSLVYANTLPVPKDVFFNSGSWKELADWQKELGPHYDTALRMLGATRNPKLFRGDHILEQIGEEIGKKDHFNATNVAVYFGEEGKTAEDPFFGGKGPERTGCIHCGACMTGCRHNAKNTLDKNYLYLAQQLGVEIMAEQEVYDVRPNGAEDGSDGYVVCYQSSTKLFKKRHRVRAKGVVFSAGVLGTIKLLLKLKGQGSLPRVSDRLGQDIRTNNESLICIRTHEKGDDLSEGVAIGSILHTDDDSHMEVVRYGKGSGFWRFSLLPMVRGKNLLIRIGQIIAKAVTNPIYTIKIFFTKDWASRTSILLFMQTLDSTLRFSLNGLGQMVSSVNSGKKPSALIPRAYELAKRYEALIKGRAGVFFLEPLAGIPSTAHILGGAVMGANEQEGVIDKNNHVFGYENLMVCDGSMISANPGVNPSLSITAISERAISQVPEKDASEGLTGFAQAGAPDKAVRSR